MFCDKIAYLFKAFAAMDCLNVIGWLFITADYEPMAMWVISLFYIVKITISPPK